MVRTNERVITLYGRVIEQNCELTFWGFFGDFSKYSLGFGEKSEFSLDSGWNGEAVRIIKTHVEVPTTTKRDLKM